jgi:hypothetical protein
VLKGFKGGSQLRIFRELRGCRASEDDVSAGRLKPIAVLIEVGVNAGSANDYISGFFERGVFHALEDVFEDAGEFALSPGKKPGGVGVTVEGDAVGDMVILGEPPRAGPANELALDGIAIRMGTNAAPAGMARKIGRKILRIQRGTGWRREEFLARERWVACFGLCC